MKVKILHLADMQYEVRTSGKMKQRGREFKHMNDSVLKIAQDEQPHIVYIGGDIYEFHEANGEEGKLFADLLNGLLDIGSIMRIIIICGNHDIKQSGAKAIIENGISRNLTDHITPIVAAIDSEIISYFPETGFYVDPVFDITWVVWGHTTKYSASTNPMPYSPWKMPIKHEFTTNGRIELFHDPIKGSIGFDGKPDKFFENYSITLKSFGCNTVLCGDIHAPMHIQKDKFFFSYPSSTCMRNFGEGDYWFNDKLAVNGNKQHGLNIIEFDDEENCVTDFKWYRINPIVGRHKIYLSNDFDFSDESINGLSIEEYDTNHIIVVCQCDFALFNENIDKIALALSSKYLAVTVAFDYDKTTAVTEQTEIEIIEKVTDLETILEISNNYIEQIVDKTTIIAKDSKDYAKEMLCEIVEKELSKLNLELDTRQINLISAKTSHFMSFGADISFEFGNQPITRIVGSNGVGKTTIFHFVSWMFKNKINSEMSNRETTKGKLDLFNDTTNSNDLFGELVFELNNVTYTLKKAMSKVWKKKRGGKMVVDNIDESWSLVSSNYHSSSKKEIQEWLVDNVFPSYEDYTRMMFINNEILTNFLKRDSDKLNQEILDSIGFNFSDILMGEFNNVKEKALKGLTKHAKTFDELSSEINQQTDKITAAQDQIELLQAEIVNDSNESETLEIVINEKRSLVHNVGTTSKIDNEIVRNQELILSLKLELSQYEDANKNKKAIEELKRYVEDYTKMVDSQLVLIKALKNNIVGKNTEKENVLQRLELEFAQKVSQHNIKIQELKNIVHEKNAIMRKLNNEIVSELSTKTNILLKKSLEEQKVLSSKEADLKDTKRNVADAKREIAKLEDSLKTKTCNACGQPVKKNDEHIKTTNKTIEEIKSQIVEFEKQIVVINGEIGNVNKIISDIKSNIDVIGDVEIKPNDPYLIKNNPDALEAMKTANKEKNDAKRDGADLEQEISTMRESHDDDVKVNPEIEAINQEIERIKENVNEENQKLKVNKTNLLNFENRLAESSKYVVTDEQLQAVKDKLSNAIHKESSLKDDMKKSKEDVETNSEIDSLNDNHKTIAKSIQNKKLKINTLEGEILHAEKVKNDIKNYIEEAKEYNIVESVMKLYRKMLGKSGLSKYVFQHIIPIFNNKFVELLEDLPFSLYFDENDLDLRLDYNGVDRSVLYASGMETVMMGLALMTAIRDMNTGFKVNQMFIDELSGKLSSGDDLPYVAENFQELFSKFIGKLSKKTNVLIVDHVIEYLNESQRIIVEKTKDGSKIDVWQLGNKDA